MKIDLSYSPEVVFRPPEYARLKKNGMVGVDMHYHTNHSDSHTRVRDALKLAKFKGIGLSITDHNQISGFFEAKRIDDSVLCIPGTEVSAWDGPHILLYFFSGGDMEECYKKEIENKKSSSPYLATKLGTEDIVEIAQDYNCLTIAAHPFGYLLFNKGLGKCIEREYLHPKIISDFSGLEVICGGMTRKLNLKAAGLACKNKLCMTGGTDGHLLRDLGNVLTCSYAEDTEDFLEELIHRRNYIVGQEKSLIEKGVMATAIMPKYFRYTAPSLRIHYSQNAPRLKHFGEKYLSRKK